MSCMSKNSVLKRAQFEPPGTLLFPAKPTHLSLKVDKARDQIFGLEQEVCKEWRNGIIICCCWFVALRDLIVGRQMSPIIKCDPVSLQRRDLKKNCEHFYLLVPSKCRLCKRDSGQMDLTINSFIRSPHFIFTMILPISAWNICKASMGH